MPTPILHRLLAGSLVFATTLAGAQQVSNPDDPPAAVWPVDDGAPLRVLAERHGIGIGHAMRFNWPALDDSAVYEDIVAREFGLVTPESSMKWDPLRPSPGEYDFRDLDALDAFADEHDILLHGHPLVWYRLNPEWVDELPPAALEEAMVSHIRTLMTRWPGRYPVWDVVNEAVDDDGAALRDSPFLDAMGPDYIDIAFRAARAADPGATLLYNDYDIGWPTAKRDAVFELLDDMIARDVPVDGVGFQMHLDLDFAHAEGFSTTMQAAADRGLDVYVTEFDVTVPGPADFDAQGLLYEDILERCLMQPACKAFQVWGLDDVHSFRPQFRPLPFDEDFGAKPAFFAMRRALETAPVHPESCSLDGAVVVSGAIVVAGPVAGSGEVGSDGVGSDGVGSDGVGSDGVGDADASVNASATARCDGVGLGPGYAELAVRYANPGEVDGSLAVRVAGTNEPVLSLALPPTVDTGDGSFETLRAATVSMPVGDVALELELVGDAVALDALLFDAPAGAVADGFGIGSTGEGAGVPGGAGIVRAAIDEGGAQDGTAGGGPGTAVPDTGGEGGPARDVAPARVGGGGSGGGTTGALWLLALAGALRTRRGAGRGPLSRGDGGSCGCRDRSPSRPAR